MPSPTVCHQKAQAFLAFAPGLLGPSALGPVLFQGLGHGVEGAGQGREFGHIPGLAHARGQISAAEPGRGCGQGLESAPQGPHAEIPAEQHGQPQGQGQDDQVAVQPGPGLGRQRRLGNSGQDVHVRGVVRAEPHLLVGVDPAHPVRGHLPEDARVRALLHGLQYGRVDGPAHGQGAVGREAVYALAPVVRRADEGVLREGDELEQLPETVQAVAGQEHRAHRARLVQHGQGEGEDRGLQGHSELVFPGGEPPGPQRLVEMPGPGEIALPGRGARGDEVAVRGDQVQGCIEPVDLEQPGEQFGAFRGVARAHQGQGGQALQEAPGLLGHAHLAGGQAAGEGGEVLLRLGHGLPVAVHPRVEDEQQGRQGGDQQQEGQPLPDRALQQP